MKFTIDVKDKYIDDSVQMLHDYFRVTVTKKYLARLLKKDVRLLCEVADGAVTDTYVRDMFIDTITEDMGVNHWPSNGDSNEYSKRFYKKFAVECKKRGIGVELDD